ncbi:MAG: polynucleotide adenylyltransferase PcnB [Rhabdochlamydiaceae bacterium]|nr:polynucleotide adenylyltransferase PcnB [Candidatus Amphrikana amoebophyrae]
MQPKNYTVDQHKIPLQKIDSDALFVIRELQKAGYTSYLVGGSIRDLLLGHTPKDYDISTSALPEEVKKVFRSRCILIGRRFRLAHIRFRNKIIEVATFRSGNIEGDDLIVNDNEWGTPAEDVLRRDFKINGLFFDPSTETLIDYVGGFEDSLNKTLQAIGEPYVRFKQDPVRMIRLIKFQARFDLTIDEKTKLDFLECRSEILKSSQARILEELMRMLHSGSASKFMKLMSEYGLLEQLLPEISSFIENDKDETSFRFLAEIDSMLNKYSDLKIGRAILISTLLFPIIHKNVMDLTVERTKPPHIGLIQNIIRSHIESSFSAFFQLSRKIKSEILYLISWQYRLTPLKSETKPNRKIPTSIQFVLALKFLNLRSRLNPEYQDVWSKWRDAYEEVKIDPGYFKTYKPRRRGKRR